MKKDVNKLLVKNNSGSNQRQKESTTGQDIATFRDNGTEVPSLSRDKGTTGQAKNLSKGQGRASTAKIQDGTGQPKSGTGRDSQKPGRDTGQSRKGRSKTEKGCSKTEKDVLKQERMF